MQSIDLHFQGIPNAIASYLIETTQGPILVETGPHSTLPRLTVELKQFGYRLEDIQHVFLTHIHLDHAGAAWAFAQKGAKIYVHPLGLIHLADPAKLMASAARIYKEDMDRLWGQMKPIASDRLIPVEHGARITLGDKTIRALHTPGHATHHIAWVLDDSIFAGDVAGVKIGDGPVVPPCPPPDIHLEDWERSIQILLAEAPAQILLTHFGQVTNIEAHLIELKTELQAWSNWIKPHYFRGTDPGQIEPAFQKFVQRRLLEKGVDQEQLRKYELANPSWMSVAGLLRYWHKKTKTKDD